MYDVNNIKRNPNRCFSIVRTSFSGDRGHTCLSSFQKGGVGICRLSSNAFLPRRAVLLPRRYHFPVFCVSSGRGRLAMFRIPFRTDGVGAHCGRPGIGFN